MHISTPARWFGAIGAAVTAYAHISLYRAGYSDIPVANIGTQFLLNAAGGIAVAVGLLAPLFIASLPSWTTKAAAGLGIVWSVMSLVAYTLSHSDRGWMGYNDGPAFFQPSPEGAMSVFGELAVLVATVVIIAVAGRRPDVASD
jgi:4-amino-4-deoxy-L-arabinose transferase-like glycosyltransferase